MSDPQTHGLQGKRFSESSVKNLRPLPQTTEHIKLAEYALSRTVWDLLVKNVSKKYEQTWEAQKKRVYVGLATQLYYFSWVMPYIPSPATLFPTSCSTLTQRLRQIYAYCNTRGTYVEQLTLAGTMQRAVTQLVLRSCSMLVGQRILVLASAR